MVCIKFGCNTPRCEDDGDNSGGDGNSNQAEY